MAVTVALAMVLIMACAALGIDAASIFSDQEQLQNGADAGALAYAESCMRGSCVDKTNVYAKANKLDGNATGAVTAATAGSVSVQVSSLHQNWFAGIIGMPTINLKARATATYGLPAGAPLTFSWCEFNKDTGGWNGTVPAKSDEVTISLKSGNAYTCVTHNGANVVPGGFGWLVSGQKSGDCSTDPTDASVWVPNSDGTFHVDSNTGNKNPCTAAYWTALQGKTILLPIFTTDGGNGNNAWYGIAGMAAFKLTGYCFQAGVEWDPTHLGCSGGNGWIRGVFTGYSTLPDSHIDTSTGLVTGAVKLTG